MRKIVPIYLITLQDKYFVTRLKDNAVVNNIEYLKVTYAESKLLDDKTKIVSDRVVQLGSESTYKTKNSYRVIKIIDISPLAALTKLSSFQLYNNQISILTPLVTNVQAGGFASIGFIDLRINKLDLSYLKSKGIYVKY